MSAPRISAVLTAPGRPDRFASVRKPLSGIVHSIDFEGEVYRRTPRKSDGGWPVYVLAKGAPSDA